MHKAFSRRQLGFSTQHQTSTARFVTCGRNRVTPVLPRSRWLVPTSTPKPRAEGRVRASGTQATSRPERSGDQVLLPLPKKSGIACAVPDFFRLRPQARLRCVSWGPAARWAASRPDRGGSRDKSVPRIPSSFPVFSIRSHLFATVPIPSSTQNAPGFAFFGLNRVRFSLFRCFPAAKFSGLFLCILPHSAHKLKPSVIPCKREVSFLT